VPPLRGRRHGLAAFSTCTVLLFRPSPESDPPDRPVNSAAPGGLCLEASRGDGPTAVAGCHDSNERRTAHPRSPIPPRHQPSRPPMRMSPPPTRTPSRWTREPHRAALSWPARRPDRVHRHRARAHDHPGRLGRTRHRDLQAVDHHRRHHPGPELHQHRLDHLRGHLHRRRRRDPAVPRVPRRAARPVVHLHRDPVTC